MSTLLALRTLIKFEARIAGDDTFNSFVDNTINEVLFEKASKDKYFELQARTTIVLTASTGDVDLPADFLLFERVEFAGVGGLVHYRLDPFNGLTQPPRTAGRPNTFELVGTKIRLAPQGGIASGDAILLDYYKTPTPLSADGDAFPLARIEPLVKREVIQRVLTFHEKVNEAQLLDKKAGEAQVAAASANLVEQIQEH